MSRVSGHLRRARGLRRRLVELLRQSELHATSAASKAAQTHLAVYYRGLRVSGAALPPIQTTGFRVLSQFDEDGLLLFLFSVLDPGRSTFLDIGSGDGVHGSNCANLALNLGWDGLFVDARPVVDRGRAFYAAHPDTWAHPPRFRQLVVTPENVNELVEQSGLTDLDLLSIDIDGNDYWVWKALRAARPRVVVVEARIELGRARVVARAGPGNVAPGDPPGCWGASPAALLDLGAEKGYRLIATNRFGFNLVFVRDDQAEGLLPEIGLEDVFRHLRSRAIEAISRPAQIGFIEVS